MRHVASVTLWTQGVFGLNQIALETIVNRAKYFDYAIFIFSNDDIVSIRGIAQDSVRDNVIFELGFFCESSAQSAASFWCQKPQTCSVFPVT